MLKQVVAEVAGGNKEVFRKLLPIARASEYKDSGNLRTYLLGYMENETGVKAEMVDVRAVGGKSL